MIKKITLKGNITTMAKLKYAYYPGCAAKQIQKEADWSARAICEKMSVELNDMPKASCCGAGNLQEHDPAAALAINARIFSEAEEMGMDIVTICNTCLQTFTFAWTRLQDEDIRNQINEILVKAGVKPFENKIKVKHLIWALVEEIGLDTIKEHVNNPLNGLKVAPFYGCHSMRPNEIFGKKGGEEPKYLDQLIEVIGGESVNYNGKDKCCGFHTMLVNEKEFLHMSGGHSLEAKEKGAEVMVSPCSLCDMAMGAYQAKSEKAIGKKINLPEMSIQQLMGTAMGLDAKSLGFSRLHQDPRPALKAKGVNA